jgi:hypothetical protein
MSRTLKTGASATALPFSFLLTTHQTMFKTITWGQYAGLIFVLLVAYYLYVAVAYYRVEIMARLKGPSKAGATPEATGSAMARPSLVGSSGPLISKSALAIQPPTAKQEAKTQAPTEALEERIEESESDEIKIKSQNTDKINNLSHGDNEEALPGPQAADPEEEFTVGVAQLSGYFEEAAAGTITQDELVAKMPELDNTALLVAFFQSNAKAAQQLTSQYYVDVPEPVLD